MIKFSNRRRLVVVGFVAVLGTTTSVLVTAQPPEQPPMFQAFTVKARNSIAAGITKAKELKRKEMGTDFLLWALVSDKDGTAAEVLQKMDVPIDAVRLQAEAEMAWSNETDAEPPEEEPKLTEGVKRVLEFAADEAKRLPGENKDIEDEHLLLGLLRYKQDLPFSYTVLRKSGVTLEKARQQVVKQRRE